MLVAIALVMISVAITPQLEMAGGAAAPSRVAASALPATSLAVPESTAFPVAGQVNLANEAQLALTVAAALDYGDSEFVDSSEGSEFHPATLSRVIQSPFHAGGNDLAERTFSLGANGSLKLYYNGDGEFIGFAATLPTNSSRVTDSAQYAASALSLGAALGIPESMLAVVNVSYQNSSSTSLPADEEYLDSNLSGQSGTVTWFNHTVIVADSAPSLNLVPTGCNALGLMYDGDTGWLILVEAWRFVELPVTCTVTSDQAVETARADLVSHLYTKSDIVVRDGLASLRLDAQTLRFGYQYEALLEIPDENSSYSVLLLVDLDTGTVFHSERTVPTGGWTPVVRTFPWLPLTVSLVLIVLVFGACILLSPEFALLFMGSYLVLLYIRLKGANILDNYNRGRIMGFISARPGASFAEIRDSLKMANGNLAYHLCVMEKLELISSAKQGRLRTFYQAGVGYARDELHILGKTESQILDKLGKDGPLSNADIAGSLGMSRQRVHYNLRLLEKRGLADRRGSLWQVSPPSSGSPHGGASGAEH